ncbi:GntR family transcriptional regulator [Kineothrix sp. MSJ-39]|uniref:GntR family transcriptional regulator n=1 Tax=Kineothrix sp. MSJ-39 TaxID=2841533 RepID=UPI001C12288F|nr:GntR family transcriptional regulator [Kineothrix sp. MSJ-39]MBU5429457.1 GntR family transcriptional regulator [Kineothrix sp. MSJ-39]
MIQLDERSSKPLYEQIIEQFKLLVMRESLNPGDAIPSVRRLAAELGITPSTVAKAYQELERQGVIETIRAKGTFIAQEVEIRMDDKKVLSLRNSLKSIALELKMMGYTREQVMELMAEAYEEI